MHAASARISSQEDPQIVIERLARGRISQEQADHYFMEQIENERDKSIPRLLIEIVKSAFKEHPKTR